METTTTATSRHAAALTEQATGACAFFLLVEDGSVLSRVNLYDIEGRTANLGYRVAERVAGRGVATSAVRDVCRLAVSEHELRALAAVTSRENVASQGVLLRNGFVPLGPADPADVGGKQGTRYRRDLAGP